VENLGSKPHRTFNELVREMLEHDLELEFEGVDATKHHGAPTRHLYKRPGRATTFG
jgi:hypothetical protein